MPLLIGQLERDRKQGAERGGLTCSKGHAGIEPGPTAKRTVAFVHGAPAQPTMPLTTLKYLN